MNIFSRGRRQRGFTLIEILTVVAMIGIILLVVIPNFLAFYSGNKLRTSLRQFTTDVRSVRQRAVTRHHQTRVTYSVGAGARQYALLELDESNSWVAIGSAKSLADVIYFSSTGFTSTVGDSRPDIVFGTDGTVQNMPSNTNDAYVVISTDQKTGKPQYNVQFSLTGALKTQ